MHHNSKRFYPCSGLGSILTFLVNGCGQKEVRTIGRGVTPTTGQITKEELRELLDNYPVFFRSTLRQTARNLSNSDEFLAVSHNSVDSDICRAIVDVDRYLKLIESGYNVWYKGELFVARKILATNADFTER